jgi:hypothetical protein
MRDPTEDYSSSAVGVDLMCDWEDYFQNLDPDKEFLERSYNFTDGNPVPRVGGSAWSEVGASVASPWREVASGMAMHRKLYIHR